MKLDPHEEGMRWLLQARQDLDDANYNLEGKRYHLACFLSQQAGEKALKAFLYSKGEEMVLGHSVAKLLKSATGLDPVTVRLATRLGDVRVCLQDTNLSCNVVKN